MGIYHFLHAGDILQIAAPNPMFNHGAAIVAGDHAYRASKLFLDFLCRKIANGREIQHRFLAAKLPGGIDFGVVIEVPTGKTHISQRSSGNSKQPQHVIVGMFCKFKAMLNAEKRHFHIGLSCCKPNFSYINITQDSLVPVQCNFHLIRTTIWHRRQGNKPVSSVRFCNAMISAEADLCPARTFTENADRHICLQHHMVSKNYRKIHVDPSLFLIV